MGIHRRVEYVRWCDNADCGNCLGSEAADWRTRKEAEEAALANGWSRFRGKWFCRACVIDAQLKWLKEQSHA